MLNIIKHWIKYSVYGIVFFNCIYGLGQKKIEFGQIAVEDFNDNYKELFPDANAIVLYRYVEDEIGSYIIVHERIQVINENGYSVANVKIPYGNVVKIEGFTYNLVNGQIEQIKLDKFLQGSDRKVQITNTQKFTMPKVQVGSIIEYRYKATRGTHWDIPMQYNIPIRKLNITLGNATGNNFKFLQNRRALLDIDIQSYSSTTVIIANDIEPLEEEVYVSDMESYRSKIEIKNIGAMRRQSLRSYDDLVEILLNTDDFTRGYLPRNVYKKELEQIIGQEKNKYKIAELIYYYIKENFTWNEYYGIFPGNESSRVAFHAKKGDVADINLLYVSMLRTVGIDAEPILASTRWNGLPMTASWESFNYILAGAKINNQQYIFDVAHDKSNFEMIPKEVLNWKGLMLHDDQTYSWINLSNRSVSGINKIINIEIDEFLSIKGNVKEQITGYYAMDFEKYFKENKGRNYDINDIVGYNGSEFEIKNFKLQRIDSAYDKISWSYGISSEDDIEEIDDKIYISPLLFYTLNESPFVNEERRYPISFEFPKRIKKIIIIKFPNEYKIESLPSSIKLNLPEAIGHFLYNIKEVGNTIQLVTEFMVDEGEIPSEKYLELKEFFKLRVEKENEKIVLVKI